MYIHLYMHIQKYRLRYKYTLCNIPYALPSNGHGQAAEKLRRGRPRRLLHAHVGTERNETHRSSWVSATKNEMNGAWMAFISIHNHIHNIYIYTYIYIYIYIYMYLFHMYLFVLYLFIELTRVDFGLTYRYIENLPAWLGMILDICVVNGVSRTTDKLRGYWLVHFGLVHTLWLGWWSLMTSA